MRIYLSLLLLLTAVNFVLAAVCLLREDRRHTLPFGVFAAVALLCWLPPAGLLIVLYASRRAARRLSLLRLASDRGDAVELPRQESTR